VSELNPQYLFGLLVFLVLCSAFFASAETSLLSLNRYRLRYLAKQGRRGAKRASTLLNRPQLLLGVLHFCNTLVIVLAATVAAVLASTLWGDLGLILSTLGLTLALLLFADITPRTLAVLRPEAFAFPFSAPVRLLVELLAPLVWLLNAISNGLLRLCRIDPTRKRQDGLSAEELRSVVREATHELPQNRQSMLLSILDLETVTVNDIMIPRNEVTGINLDDPLDDIITQLRTTSHTRLPVFRNDLNQVEGVVHMRQIARLLTHDQLTIDALSAAAHEPYFVPESTPLSTQLLNFQKHKRRIGIVVDEYGDVQGIVTLEDILEEIVGDFSNQDALRSPDIHPQEDGTQVIDGAAYIREVNKALGWSLPCDGPKTLNGLITEALENIPDSAVCLKIGPYRLEILQSTDNRVKSVRVWRPAPRANTETPAENAD
jgi:Mg2+/Co2+ transporter CorB